MLAGSQAGARVTYRLGGRGSPLAATLRVSSPLQDLEGAEAALGLDWQPRARLPLHILAERRQKLGPRGRSAFSAAVYGGFDGARAGPLRIDGYGEAGVVGLRRRDLFADGALRAAFPIAGRARIGAGVWAAAQPGVSRIDVGPHAELLVRAGSGVRLSADWRFRVAGSARPASGPALTLAAGF